ncbi:unnamed protein product [Paramecium primaurelia]|uniref:Uncharacterized protein n=1 Tax=Paramecium primaurelia TaxID=5886 RepID=A0A8S1L0C7_PARPR|nr:unnamed protein product [Paramecium primaurelia]
MNADFGETDLLVALIQGIYNENYQKCKYHSQDFKCFLLTDGEDFLKKSVSQYKKNEDMKLEINHCSEYLVIRLAEVGNGECQLVGYNEDINYKVIDLLEDSLNIYLK